MICQSQVFFLYPETVRLYKPYLTHSQLDTLITVSGVLACVSFTEDYSPEFRFVALGGHLALYQPCSLAGPENLQ